ncbi:glutathione S-transferase family protein [Roseibium marinum]|uniref:Glutathione S-transferase n=1 Tax=Roseibium marinum TaxID=281252 RepID=A0A2S3UTN7_9HYPH|nr:glutathione S-transferase N-terminal domain-containing protein [Roseibium marinum]POF30943.1 glutathione S-transferase [Roseibium marinum]
MILELYYAPTSPYVRKVMICAHELGVADEIVCLDSAAHPVNRDDRIKAFNPLGKVPAARADDGLVLYDSRVICEYLDFRCKGSLFPRDGVARWAALRRQALGDGLMDAALLARYETVARPADARSAAWRDAQLSKVNDALGEMQRDCADISGAFDIGVISYVCALGYLDFRFAELEWRISHPDLGRWYVALAGRRSVEITVPVE